MRKDTGATEQTTAIALIFTKRFPGLDQMGIESPREYFHYSFVPQKQSQLSLFYCGVVSSEFPLGLVLYSYILECVCLSETVKFLAQ